MAYHGNRWSPDHCKCQILFCFDDELPQEERIHTFEERQKDWQGNDIATKRCEIHKHHKEELHAVVLEENQRKNLVLSKAQELFPDINFEYSFDENRDLHIKHNGKLTKKEENNITEEVTKYLEKVKIENAIDTHKDKVTIHG